MDDSGPLHELAASYGIDTQYWDWQGQHRTVPPDTLRAVLSAFGVDAGTPESCRAALGLRSHPTALPPCIVLRAGRTHPIPTPGHVELEEGLLVPVGSELPGDLPLGYHHLVLDAGSITPVIVTPDRLELPTALQEAPGWGLATQLYSVRSRGSWGVGDLADLRTLAEWTAREHGADFVLINPVHAGEIVPPLDPSPYLPTSRRFADPLYLRLEDLPEYAALPAADRARVDALGERVRASAPADRIDRDPAWTAKLEALQILLAPGLGAERARRFARYRDPGAIRRDGAVTPLERFATWSALCEMHGNDWREWPAELRDPEGPAVGAFAAEHDERVQFFMQVQFLLDEQLTAVQAAARAAGMALGIVHDVAVGVSPAGADAWAYQETMATSCTVGAPPDAYSQRGQDWRQPPWRPDRLAATGYAPIRELFATALRYCGGLRVDHIIGLFRLWWIPAGRPALEGTYVHYDHEALIGVLALEAHRAGAVVIGEDLGNVEPSARAYLRERGLLGTSILWFESDPDSPGRPLAPERWRSYCLASVTTHDLPPTAGYLAGDHIRLRDDLGLLTRSVEEELAAGRAEQAAWLGELVRVGLLPSPDDRDGEPDTAEIVLALHRFLTLTPARLRCAALTDAVGDRRTQNQPGTVDQYPNWRVPLSGPDGVPVLLEDVVADAAVAAVLATLAPGPPHLSR